VGLLAAANAQKEFGGKGPGTPKAGCLKLADIKPIKDPLTMFEPGKADFHCDMGAPIPFGPVPSGCTKLEIIVARGTSEPGPLGNIVGDPLVARVKRDLKEATAQGYPVQYPAASKGQEIGSADIPKRIAAQIAACPNIKFALAGYSQGGMVVLQSLAKLSASQLDRVVAIALYGATDGSPIREALKGRTIANCAPGDFACPNGGTGAGHVSYNNKGTIWHDRTSKYIVEAFIGKSLGYKIMRSETAQL
jgi:cutinase